MESGNLMRRGHAVAHDAREAVMAFHSQVAQPDMAAVLFFCSSGYDLDALADEMTRRFAGITVVGCTTAGEIGPDGYCAHSLSGASFAAAAFVAEAGRLDALQAFDMPAGREFSQKLLARLDAQKKTGHTFGLLLIDGLSLREEPVTHALQDGLGGVPMFGGSAGDDLKFERTWVFQEGHFRTDCAVLLLLSTKLPFRILRSQHFVADGEQMVVTEVDAAHRIVREINGLPAANEYARMVGVVPDKLTPDHFANCPVVVMIDGTDFVRSIQHANPDGSLTFYCAIDEGVVLRVAYGVNLLGKTEAVLAEIERELGEIEGMLVCDCILRNLEVTREGKKQAAGDLFKRYKAVGFSTYGEQLGGVHINQTLTGIAIGCAGDENGG